MARIVTLHLDPAELRVVGQVCHSDGHTLRQLAPSELGELRSAPQSWIVAAAHDADQLRTVKRAIANAPHHWYAVGAPVGERDLAFSLASHLDIVPFFLPPLPDKLRVALRRLADRHLRQQRSAIVVGGTQSLDHRLSWKSADIDVSAVSRYVAGVLQAAGFYADPSQLDQVALSLEEALTNALEHGNLELDSALRHTVGEIGDASEELRAARLADPTYGDRPVTVAVHLGADRASVTVTDVGKGFDIATAQERLDARRRVERVVHRDEVSAGSGKGFDLIARWFDQVDFGEGGRAVALTRLRPEATPAG